MIVMSPCPTSSPCSAISLRAVARIRSWLRSESRYRGGRSRGEGISGPGRHYHDQEEQYFIIDGEITYRADGSELQAGPGSFVLIPRCTVHSFRVESESATLLNCYIPVGFERTIMDLGGRAQAEIPPSERPAIPGGWTTP